MRFFLATLLATTTGQPRYFPDIEWSDSSWTHNVFRAYEYVFGRRYGIKPEMSTYVDEKVYYACHSWESVCALTETYIRNILFSRKFIPFRIYVPIIKTTQGIPFFASPYLFAIALDSADANMSSQGQANSMNITHTCTGSNLIVFVSTEVNSNTNVVTGITYNSVAMSLVDAGLQSIDSGTIVLYLQTNPSTGIQTAAISASASTIFRAYSISYSGANAAGQPDSHNNQSGVTVGANPVSVSTTVVASNCWLLMASSNDTGEPTADSGIRRGTSSGSGFGTFDSNGTVGTGSQSLSFNIASTGRYATAICSFAPAGGAVIAVPFKTLLGVGI